MWFCCCIALFHVTVLCAPCLSAGGRQCVVSATRLRAPPSSAAMGVAKTTSIRCAGGGASCAWLDCPTLQCSAYCFGWSWILRPHSCTSWLAGFVRLSSNLDCGHCTRLRCAMLSWARCVALGCASWAGLGLDWTVLRWSVSFLPKLPMVSRAAVWAAGYGLQGCGGAICCPMQPAICTLCCAALRCAHGCVLYIL